MNTPGVLSGTAGNSIHVLNMQHFDLIKTLWLEAQNNGYHWVLQLSLHLPFCNPVYIYIYIYICMLTQKICGFTWAGVKSEAVRFFPHILVELCATPVPFSSIFPSFHISIGTNLSHRMSCSRRLYLLTCDSNKRCYLKK